MPDEPWRDQAACRGRGELMYAPAYPERREELRRRLGAALALCAGCPVRERCRDAGRDEQYGIWGGVTELGRRRRRLRERRPAARRS